MRRIPHTAAAWLLALTAYGQTTAAQAPRTITIEDAEEMALRNRPGIAAADFRAQASNAVVTQTRSAFQPILVGSVTTVGADPNTAIAAGALQTSGLASRAATGLTISQLITDFGRTSSLVDSARLRAAAQKQNVATTRAQVLLQVEQAFYAALAADSVHKVAQARVEMQALTTRQVRALASSSLKSTLDVSFAEVALSEAQLALDQAGNAAKAQRALLAAAMGEGTNQSFELADVPLPGPLAADAEALVAEALTNRPDLAGARLSASSAHRYAEAEGKLRYPAMSFVGAAGAIPLRQSSLSSQYGAAGLNISIPFFNGRLFAARQEEAELRAHGAEKESQELSVQIAGSVRVAWLEADTAWRRIDVTARLVDQAATALRLAKARYDIGLSGILELTQAQLAHTSAQIASANAKYDYLTRMANLNYAIGALR